MSDKTGKKICGIIAEYNPFHNGHKYLLDHARKDLGADYVIIVMSGDFVQRGEPALMDKYARTEAALSEGADLVLELPVIFSTGSAQYFARGAVSTLIHTGCTDTLLFGSESGDIDSLSTEADDMSPDYARRTDASSYNLPNNILGKEYISALRFFSDDRIRPQTVKRKGAGYNDMEAADGFASATGIRKMLLESPGDLKALSGFIPGSQIGIIEKYVSANTLLCADDLSDILRYILIKTISNGNDLCDIFDIYDDLSDKIIKNVPCFDTYTGFIRTLKSKELAWSHISRALLHIILGIKKSDVKTVTSDLNYCPYLRPLGFKKDATELLSLIKEHSDVPFISKLADSKEILSEPALNILKKDIFASELYRSKASPSGFTSEYRMPILIK